MYAHIDANNSTTDHFYGGRDKAVTYATFSISSLLWLLATIGNIRILQYARRKLKSVSAVSNSIFLCLAYGNNVACLIAVPAHLIKLSFDVTQNIYMSSYFCLLRYLITMITIDLSLISVTSLIIDRKDKIVKQPFGIRSFIRKDNLKTCITICFFVTFIPNLIMTSVYLYIMEHDSILPCQKEINDSKTHLVLPIIESIKKISVAAPSLTLMIRAIAELRRKIKERNDHSMRMKKALKKINATYFYAVAFLVFWVPFGCMAISSGSIRKEFYNAWFNIGYSISYGYLLAIPVVCAITDRHFNLRRAFSSVPSPSQVIRNTNTVFTLKVQESSRLG